MALEDDVKRELINAGTQLKDDLWTPADLELLSQRAKDLVGLHTKAQTTTNPNKKSQYQFAAKLVVQHVELLALTRMAVAEKHIQEALSRFFFKVLIPNLVKLLPLLF